MNSGKDIVTGKMLVIDDDPAILESIKRQLKNQKRLALDFESNPLEGLRRLDAETYDLVLCDIKMAPIDGLEVLARIKHGHPLIPVIMLSGFVDDQVIESAQAIGSSAFLIKPIRKADLIESIVQVLATSGT
jgi:two-component system response regulator YesN